MRNFRLFLSVKQTHDKNIIYNLDGISIVCDDEVKLLGVTIDFKLNFSSHITNICKKAARQLNVLKWIGKHLDRFGKLTIYHSIIMSNVSYCRLPGTGKYKNVLLFAFVILFAFIWFYLLLCALICFLCALTCFYMFIFDLSVLACFKFFLCLLVCML